MVLRCSGVLLDEGIRYGVGEATGVRMKRSFLPGMVLVLVLVTWACIYNPSCRHRFAGTV